MGLHIGITAVRSNSIKKVLKSVSKYLVHADMSLDSGVSADSDEIYSYDFQIITHKGWVVFKYNGRAAANTLRVDYMFSKHISEDLKTDIVDYYRYDTVNSVAVRYFKDGFEEDLFSYSDAFGPEIIENDGWFEEYDDDWIEGFGDDGVGAGELVDKYLDESELFNSIPLWEFIDEPGEPYHLDGMKHIMNDYINKLENI